MQLSNITVVIPCRKGSQRVKNKNFKNFSDSSLLEIKINQAKKLGLNVVVNSDSEIAEKISKDNDIGFIQRPKYYASSECNNSEHYEYLGKSVSTDLIMILQPTAPLIKDETLKKCLEMFISNIDSYDSLVTSQYAKKHVWFNNKPINYNLKNTQNSQDLKSGILPTFGVIICKTKKLIECRNVITDRCLFYKIDDVESIEIDTELEFEIAEFLYNKRIYND